MGGKIGKLSSDSKQCTCICLLVRGISEFGIYYINPRIGNEGNQCCVWLSALYMRKGNFNFTSISLSLLNEYWIILGWINQCDRRAVCTHNSFRLQVLDVIEDGLKTFRRSTFIKHPDLRFKYIEETDSSRFFVPYVWQIVCRTANLHFKQSALVSWYFRSDNQWV